MPLFLLLLLLLLALSLLQQQQEVHAACHLLMDHQQQQQEEKEEEKLAVYRGACRGRQTQHGLQVDWRPSSYRDLPLPLQQHLCLMLLLLLTAWHSQTAAGLSSAA